MIRYRMWAKFWVGAVLINLVVASSGCAASDTDGLSTAAKEAIENRLVNQRNFEFHFGPVLVRSAFASQFEPDDPSRGLFGDSYAVRLQQLEKSGLIKYAEVPVDQVQTIGARRFIVAPTPAFFKAMDVEPEGEFAKGLSGGSYTVTWLPVTDTKVERVIINQAYTGPLASPGEKHWIVLGVFRETATPAAALLGPELMQQLEESNRFRAVIRLDQFTNKWVVVALDVGSIRADHWYSSNVK